MLSCRTKYVRLSSTDRDFGTHSNFQVSYPNVSCLNRVFAVELKHISFANVFYNFSHTNNTFIWSGGSIILSIGNYSCDSLLQALNAALNGVMVWTQSSLTQQLSCTTSSSIALFPLSQNTHVNPMATVLGITMIYEMLPGQTVVTGFPELQNPQHVYIQSVALTGGTNMVFEKTLQDVPICAMIPLNKTFGSIIHYEPPYLDVHNFDSPQNLTTIDINLVNGNLQPLNVGNCPIHIILKVYYMV